MSNMHISKKSAFKLFKEKQKSEKEKEQKVDQVAAFEFVHNDFFISIPKNRNMLLTCFRIFRVVRVVNPSEFYMEYVVQNRATNCIGTDNWKSSESELQKFYNNSENLEKYRLRMRIMTERIYVFFNENKNEWMRAKVYNYNIVEEVAEVYLVDYDELIILQTDTTKLYELHPKFSKHSLKAFKCRLNDVDPPNDEDYWPDESINEFKNLVLGKLFHVFITNKLNCNYEPFLKSQHRLYVVLIEKKAGVTNTIQNIMVQNKWAKEWDGEGDTGLTARSFHLPEPHYYFEKYSKRIKQNLQ